MLLSHSAILNQPVNSSPQLYWYFPQSLRLVLVEIIFKFCHTLQDPLETSRKFLESFPQNAGLPTENIQKILQTHFLLTSRKLDFATSSPFWPGVPTSSPFRFVLHPLPFGSEQPEGGSQQIPWRGTSKQTEEQGRQRQGSRVKCNLAETGSCCSHLCSSPNMGTPFRADKPHSYVVCEESRAYCC